MKDPKYEVEMGILRNCGWSVVEDSGRAIIVICSAFAKRFDSPEQAIDRLIVPKRLLMSEIKPQQEYIHLPSSSSPDMAGALVVVREISMDSEDIRVIYDFSTPGGTTGHGSMHIDHARSVLRHKIKKAKG